MNTSVNLASPSQLDFNNLQVPVLAEPQSNEPNGTIGLRGEAREEHTQHRDGLDSRGLQNISGEHLKEAGTAQVLEHNEEYRERFFYEASFWIGGIGRVTSEDITNTIGMPKGHPSAVGACMKAFAQLHGLRVAGYRKAIRPRSHSAVIAIWQRV